MPSTKAIYQEGEKLVFPGPCGLVAYPREVLYSAQGGCSPYAVSRTRDYLVPVDVQALANDWLVANPNLVVYLAASCPASFCVGNRSVKEYLDGFKVWCTNDILKADMDRFQESKAARDSSGTLTTGRVFFCCFGSRSDANRNMV